MVESATLLEVPREVGEFMKHIRVVDEYVLGASEVIELAPGFYAKVPADNASDATKELWKSFYNSAMSDIAKKAFPVVTS